MAFLTSRCRAVHNPSSGLGSLFDAGFGVHPGMPKSLRRQDRVLCSLDAKASQVCRETPQVAKISKSQVKAAVKAIIEREQREGMASPILQINESNRVWIRRNLRNHLEPVFSEMRLNKDKIQEGVTRHQDEV